METLQDRGVNIQLLQLLFNAIWTLTASGSFADPNRVFNCSQYYDLRLSQTLPELALTLIERITVDDPSAI